MRRSIDAVAYQIKAHFILNSTVKPELQRPTLSKMAATFRPMLEAFSEPPSGPSFGGNVGLIILMPRSPRWLNFKWGP